MTIALSAEVEEKLKAAARRRGMEVGAYLTKLIESEAPAELPKETQIDHATIELFKRWEAEDHTEDPEELARRQKEFEEFKAGMNRNRLESEGPNARIPFP